MSFLYPRTIDIARPTNETQGGYQGYESLERDSVGAELTILSGLPASIQQRSLTGATGAKLPSDTRGNTAWRVFIPKRALNDREAIKSNDIVVDDLANRYQVTAAYWNSLGYNLLVEKLEV